MEWNKLVKIVKIHNNDDQKGLREYLKPIINEIKEGQSLDIIINSVSLSIEEFNKDKEFYKILHSHVKSMMADNMRLAIRLGRLDQLIIEDK